MQPDDLIFDWEQDYPRLSDCDLGVALSMVDTYTTVAIAQKLGCAPNTLRRNLAAIGWTR